MPFKERQDIQDLSSNAEQLHFLLQTIYECHENYSRQQLSSLLGIAFNVSASVYSWTEKEEERVLSNEEARRNDK
ncbi:hypothetical protein [Pseudescherichia sp.]|uniref:hypothetical protein n=1 Tax=Pseudescherichia sp. TaxID=2055881 RepID=UPI002897CDFF|nr:hypothetical protein [Pseudescherichia sp.]